jgi:hypothetical protein
LEPLTVDWELRDSTDASDGERVGGRWVAAAAAAAAASCCCRRTRKGGREEGRHKRQNRTRTDGRTRRERKKTNNVDAIGKREKKKEKKKKNIEFLRVVAHNNNNQNLNLTELKINMKYFNWINFCFSWSQIFLSLKSKWVMVICLFLAPKMRGHITTNQFPIPEEK